MTQVLGDFGLHVALADVSRLTRPTERSYMTAQAIVDFAPKVGMEARLYAGGSLDTVRTVIRLGLPLIARQSHIPRAGTVIPHWRVVVGYDDVRQQVYLMDPLLGDVQMSYSDFTRVWADHREQFALLYPPSWRVRAQQATG
ncbi:C39 family peptidase [Deinococcus gobiensis]